MPTPLVVKISGCLAPNFVIPAEFFFYKRYVMHTFKRVETRFPSWHIMSAVACNAAIK